MKKKNILKSFTTKDEMNKTGKFFLFIYLCEKKKIATRNSESDRKK